MTIERKKMIMREQSGLKVFIINKFLILIMKNCKKYHWIQNTKIQHNFITSERKKIMKKK